MPRGGARLLQGGPIAAEIRQAVGEDVAAYTERRGRKPVLAVVICGRDAPSMVYLNQILRSCEKVGIEGRLVEVDGEAAESSVLDAIHGLNADPAVNGIIVQMPLPPTIRLRSIVDAIDPAKDIDGIHPLNAGLLRLGYDGFLPATAHAAVEILRRSGIEIEGRRAAVVGRSAVVGMPAAFLLVRENATVTVCHSRTRDLAAVAREADLLIVAIGRAGMIGAPHIKPGALVVDVGMNRVTDPAEVRNLFGADLEKRLAVLAKRGSTLVGDVNPKEAEQLASMLTPVPGGVGLLTVAMLMKNTLRAATLRRGLAN